MGQEIGCVSGVLGTVSGLTSHMELWRTGVSTGYHCGHFGSGGIDLSVGGTLGEHDTGHAIDRHHLLDPGQRCGQWHFLASAGPHAVHPVCVAGVLVLSVPNQAGTSVLPRDGLLVVPVLLDLIGSLFRTCTRHFICPFLLS